MAKKRVTRQIIVSDPDDIFGGMGHFVPCPTIQLVDVKPPTKTQRKKLIQRLIDKLDPPHEVIKAQKPKPVKRAPKPKSAPKPKKGKKVGKVNEVCLKSPFTRETQWLPLVAELGELLTKGWEIVDADTGVEAAYDFLTKPKEKQSA